MCSANQLGVAVFIKTVIDYIRDQRSNMLVLQEVIVMAA